MKLSSVLAAVKTRTITDSAISFGGTLANGIFGFLFFLVLARTLGPDNFGLLSVAIVTLTMTADIADLGINTGLMNFVSRSLASGDKNRAFRFMKLGLKIKVLVWLIILAVGWVSSPFLAAEVFAKPQLAFPLQLAMVGVGSALLFSFAANCLQAWQRFWSWSFLNIATNGLRLLSIISMLFLLQINLQNVLLVYILVPFFGFILGIIFLSHKFLTVSGENEVAPQLFGYSKSVAAFILLAAVSSRLDTFISTRLLPISQVGIYSVAVQLTSFIPQVVFALAAVVAPKLASYKSDKEVFSYLKKLQLLVLAISSVGIVIMIIGSFAIPLVYGVNYREAVLPFIILFLAQLIFLMAIPAHQSIFYYFSRPDLFVWISLGYLIIVALLGTLLISSFGIVGASLVILVGNLFNFIVPFIWVINRFKKRGVFKK